MNTPRAHTWIFAIILGGTTWAQVTQLVSVSSGGAQGNADSENPSISPDGRFVVFSSDASTLVAGDTNGQRDIFVHDRQSGTTERVSLATDGTQGNGNSSVPSISADGRFVAFESEASNLVAGDVLEFRDIFVRDRQLGTTERISVTSSGAQGNNDSRLPSISADGRFVAFNSIATNLVPGDTNTFSDVFVRDRQNGTIERVSVATGGAQGNLMSYGPQMTPDGRFVAFYSSSTNLVAGDTNASFDIFLRDRVNGTTERVSVATGGIQANWDSDCPSISPDGRWVAFQSFASNLVAGDTNGQGDVFVHDRQSNTTERASVATNGSEGNAASGQYGPVPLSISGDGRFVAFSSYATNLVAGDTNGHIDCFLRDRQSGTTERISVDSNGAQGDGDSLDPVITADGRFIVHWSAASLVTGDTNGHRDIFVRDQSASGFTSMCSAGADGVITCPCSNAPSGPNRGCDNSSSTGGAILSASGAAYLSMDSLVFTTSAEKPTATSIVMQGNALAANGIVFGQGVRCVAGTLKRLYTTAAVAGSINAPNFGAGDPTISSRSATLGDVIQAGQSRWYLVYYRDPVVLGGCPSSSTFNATQTGQVNWSL